MTPWSVHPTAYQTLLGLSVAGWIGIVWWLRRTGRLGDLPKIVVLPLGLVVIAGWILVNDDASRQHPEIGREQIWLLGGCIVLLSGAAVAIALLRHELAQRRKAEQQLREQGALRRIIFDHAPGGVGLRNLESGLVEVNESFCRMLGYSREELIGKTARDISHPEDEPADRALDEALLSGQTDFGVLEKRYLRKDGTVVHASLGIGLIRDPAGRPQYFVGQITDINDRKRAEAELEAKQRQLATVLAHTPIVLFALDAEGRYTLCEGAGVAALGRKPGEAVGQSAFALYAAQPDIVGDLRDGLAGKSFATQREYNGAVFELHGNPSRDASGRITGLTGMALDITARVAAERERTKMETTLLEAQRLESLGVLAGGVAHDFNHALTAILGHTGLLRLTRGNQPAELAALAEIEQAAQAAAVLCRKLQAYTGQDRPELGEHSLGELVRESAALLRVTAGAKVRMQFSLAPDLPLVMADAAQIRQVLLSLVLNAVEALGQDEGVVEVASRVRQVDAAWLAEARTGQGLRAGEYVCLDISDNGSGFNAEALARAFDPFFSTKGSGRGLGLAAALGIMRSHHGALRLASQPGHGTSITLAFPARPAKPAAAPVPVTSASWRGHGSVLIVDDEPGVRAVAAQMVAHFGFAVREASSGEQALVIVRDSPMPFDLVLLDLTMPGMDGFAAFKALRELRPDQRIVIFSGYSADDTRQRFAGQNLNGFLQKPFSPDTLQEILKQVANGPAVAST